ncbi:WD repeat-containing protein 60 isoform X2 [Esox lucius]|uniref:WD repeat domain 60 n=1 Tax=Esox lucius TaxID=8010 RepID=A0A3P8XK04_ESOLU|nr:WD repeat-containing protein 60 isoform X2 [Esox lucius]
MHPEKKITKEDTWKSDDLRRHLKAGGHDEESGRRGGEYERRYRSGESGERRRRDPERDARKESVNPRDSTRERTKSRDVERERHQDRRKDGSRDRTGLREEREKDRVKNQDSGKYREGDRDRLDKRHDREEKENRERVQEREKEKERAREREKKTRETSERDREREKERDADERDWEGRPEKDRKRGEESREGRSRKDPDPERRARHMEREYLKESEHYKDGSQEKSRDKGRKQRPTEREQSQQKGDREYSEHHRREKEREMKHKQRVQHDSGESQRHKGESREAELERAHREQRRADREREKHRERRHREGAGLGRDPAKQTDTKRSSSSDVRVHKENRESANTEDVVVKSAWRSGQRPLCETEELVEIEEATPEEHGYDGAQDYEEDFEDYEEDFEEEDESEGEDNKQIPNNEERDEREDIRSQRKKEVEAIQKAMDEENKRVGSAHPRLSTERDDTPRTSQDSEIPPSKGLQQHGRFINFMAAKHREFSNMVATKQKKRSAELLRLIDLDVSVTFTLLDLPPVNEYDMYIKRFGTTNTKQAYVQCNEDNADRDIQTEEIETSEKWTQHPADWNVVCGGPTHSIEAPDESGPKLNIDSQRLVKFLCSASQVVAVLLEEDRAEKQSLKRLKSQADTLSFSDGCLSLNTNLPFLCGRPVSLVHFSQVQRQTMLSVHRPPAEPSAVRLDGKTIICVWNIWEPSRPHKVLVYESEVNCCCFSPGKATLVFAGTSVGSIVLWDLREQASAHYTLRIGENDWTLRHPTFSTDAVLAASSHMSSVISVEAIPAIMGEGLRPDLSMFSSDQESSGLSFQLASLDENGVLNTWVVLELPKANNAGSQTDLGLRPGGKVKLLHSSTVLTMSERSSSREPKKTTPLQTLLLKLLPSDSSNFFIGTNMGIVNHGTSHGLKTTPKFYKPQVVGFRPVTVTSIDFSPFGEPIFLVGCGDGSVRLHTVLNEQPLMEWSSCTAGQPVVSVQWAQTRPAVFCVLDAASCLHIWDLVEKDFEPVITEKINGDSVTAMAVFGDPAKQNTSGIALAMQSGKIEMQCFSKRFTVSESADLEKLKSMMLEVF